MKKEKANIKEIYRENYKHGCGADITYYINTKKKVIVCVVDPFVNYYHDEDDMYVDFFELCDDNDIEFIGKAFCMEEDEFNVEFGKKIAYDKAMMKLFLNENKFIKERIKVAEKFIAENKEILNDIDAKMDNIQKRFFKKMEAIK